MTDQNHFKSRRSVVQSCRGIVSCSQPLAAQAGIKILQKGGNAADAAVATAAGLEVTEPSSTSIGGDMFLLFYNAKTKKTHAMNGSGRSASTATLDYLRQEFGLKPGENKEFPTRSVHAVLVPGAPAGWVDTVEKFGSGKVSMEEILEPAIEIAENGFPVGEISAHLWQFGEPHLKSNSPNYAEVLKADSAADRGYRAPRAGEVMTNHNLAQTYRRLAKHGKKGFYEGETAEAIVSTVQALGGKLTLEDLKNHAEKGSEEVEGIHLDFHGQGLSEPIRVWEHPPNGQGLVALLALGIVQELEKAGKIPKFEFKDHNTTEYLHVIIEALRLAFADGLWYIADPSKSDIPIKELLSPEYLAKRASAFSPTSAIPHIEHDSPALKGSNTVYLSVTDPEGNAASFIYSSYSEFGSGIIAKGCGFPMQNRGSSFRLGPPEHPNIFEPGKRPYHTIIPAMITNPKDDSLNTCFGVMGAFNQPQGHLQVVMNMFALGMNPQNALDAPRICLAVTDRSGTSKSSTELVYAEEGIPGSTVEGLRKLGHNVEVVSGFARRQFGRGQIIRKSEDGGRLVYSAGSDLRGDGHAVPL